MGASREELTKRYAPTVLLVEDEPALRKLMAQVLVAEEFQVLEHAMGLEASDVYRKHGGDVDP